MAHHLQQLLKKDDPILSLALTKLEQAVGHAGVDVRLIADNRHKAHDILRAFQLDPANSTALEVYNSLKAHVSKSDRTEALLATDYVLYTFGDDVVSFNVIDIMEDIREGRTFPQRTLDHARRALMGELMHRYISHPSTHDATVRKLLEDIEIHSGIPKPSRAIP